MSPVFLVVVHILSGKSILPAPQGLKEIRATKAFKASKVHRAYKDLKELLVHIFSMEAAQIQITHTAPKSI
jgi:hypothetical protein